MPNYTDNTPPVLHITSLSTPPSLPSHTTPDSEALLCLCPWLARITLSTQWQGEWAEAFLNLLFETTTKRSSRHGYQIQQLWSTIAENRRNVVPVLEFLLNKSLQENHQKGECSVCEVEPGCAEGGMGDR